MDCTKKTPPERRRLRVLFLCTHNACRSQMAEGLLNARLSDRYAASSAGTTATAVHPLAMRVLAEVGVDISHHTSKSLALFLGESFDVVVTVCDDADKTCPAFPGGGRRIHRAFADPSRVTGSEDAILAAFRRTRDEIDAWIRETFVPEANRSCGV
jgi:arsenate reductase